MTVELKNVLNAGDFRALYVFAWFGLFFLGFVCFVCFVFLYEDILNPFPGRACIINSHKFVPLIA